MNIDIRTLTIVVSITSLLQVIAIFFQYRVNKAYLGIGWWVLGFAAIAMGYGLIFLRDLVLSKLITIIFGNALILLGSILIYIGIMRFLDKKENRSMVISIFAVFILSFFYYTYFDSNITLRTVIIYTATGIISLLVAYSLFLNKNGSIKASAYFNAALFLSQGCFFALRALVTLTVDPVSGLFTPALMQTISFLFQFIEIILVTFGLIIMVNQRLNAEMSESEIELRGSEERFRNLADATWEGIIIHKEGIVIDANKSAVKMFGYPAEELIGKNIIDFIAPESAENVLNKLREATTHDQSYLEVNVLRKDKTIISAEALGNSIIYKNLDVRVIAIRDITERKQAAEKLRKSESRYRELVENSSSIILRMDAAGKIIFLNEFAYRFLGFAIDEIIGCNVIGTIVPVTDSAGKDLEQMILNIGTHPEQFKNNENENICKNGTRVWVAWTNTPILDDQGRCVELLCIGNDITAQKNAEAEKTALKAQNSQLQKSESLSRMAAAIAHHFNNQLGVVIGHLEMVIDEQSKGASRANSLTAAMQAAWKAVDMSGLMLTYLGQSRDKVEPLDISSSCLEILPALKAAISEKVILKTDFSSPGPTISTNSNYMQQILTNLITNAREAIGKNNGTVSLSIKTVTPVEIPVKNRFPVDWQQRENDYACLEVTDTGCGIEEKDIEKLFDPFFSTKFTGRGMGLAVVLGLVNSHRGVIAVDSKPGSGSAFLVFFPLSKEVLQQKQKTVSENDTNG